MTNREKAEIVFVNELGRIKSRSLIELTLKAFDQAPDNFFTAPASSSGKYHPSISNGRYGLIRHTRLVVDVARDLCHAFNITTDEDKDNVIVACLLHDVLKFGYKSNSEGKGDKEGYKEHGYRAASYLMRFIRLPENICAAVAGHMGVWACPMAQEYTFLQTHDKLSEIVMLADYMASRKFDDKYIAISQMDIGRELDDVE